MDKPVRTLVEQLEARLARLNDNSQIVSERSYTERELVSLVRDICEVLREHENKLSQKKNKKEGK